MILFLLSMFKSLKQLLLSFLEHLHQFLCFHCLLSQLFNLLLFQSFILLLLHLSISLNAFLDPLFFPLDSLFFFLCLSQIHLHLKLFPAFVCLLNKSPHHGIVLRFTLLINLALNKLPPGYFPHVENFELLMLLLLHFLHGEFKSRSEFIFIKHFTEENIGCFLFC